MAFFTQAYVDFFNELEQNNDRDWFKARKKTFDNEIKKPFEAFVERMIDLAKTLDPMLDLDVKQSMFRIYRDTRFSKDKKPYKTHMAAIISRGGRKDMQYPGYYLQFGQQAVYIYGGAHRPERQNLHNIRMAIAEHPSEFEAVINEPKFKEFYGEVHGEKNKVIPKEFKEAAATQPMIYNKQFYCFSKFTGDDIAGTLLREDLDRFVLQHFEAAHGFNSFLAKAMFG